MPQVPPQPSPDIDQLLSFQTMTLDENIISTQSQSTQITDTQAAAFGDFSPLIGSTTYQPQSHLLTDTQTAIQSFSPLSPPQTEQPLASSGITDTRIAASDATDHAQLPHQLDTSHLPPTHIIHPTSPSLLPHNEPTSTEHEASKHKKQVHFESQPHATSDLPLPKTAD